MMSFKIMCTPVATYTTRAQAGAVIHEQTLPLIVRLQPTILTNLCRKPANENDSVTWPKYTPWVKGKQWERENIHAK